MMLIRFWCAATVFCLFPMLFSGCSRSREGVYVTPLHQELGVVDEIKSDVSAMFSIQNMTSRSVEITEISPSCRCTSVTLDKATIPSGESAMVAVTANLSSYSGEQNFSILVKTDSVQYPYFNLSFRALVAATGRRERVFHIGEYQPHDEIDYQVPSTAFAAGQIELIQDDSSNNRSNLSVKLNSFKDSQLLVISGKAPSSVGAFSHKLEFRERFVEQPRLGVGDVHLTLTGTVVSVWSMPQEIYHGFFADDESLTHSQHELKRSRVQHSEGQEVISVKGVFSEPWVRLSKYDVLADSIVIDLEVDRANASVTGKHGVESTFTLKHIDGSTSVHGSKLYVVLN